MRPLASGRHRSTLAFSQIALFIATLLTGSPVFAGGTLFFADAHNPTMNDGFIRSVNSDGYSLQTYANVGGGVRGFAYDNTVQYVYWTDVSVPKISRMWLGNPTPQDIVTSGLVTPVAIAVSPLTGWIFWGDPTVGQIGRARLDGSLAGTFLTTQFGGGIAILEFMRKIYWTTADSPTSGSIMRANLDGTLVETVLTGNGKPDHITIDGANNKIYWTDQTLLAVRSANLDGSNVQTLFSAPAGSELDGIALDLSVLTNGRVFWGQGPLGGSAGTVQQINWVGGNQRAVLSGIGLVQDMAFEPHLIGDLDCNNVVDFGDINPFVLALSNPAQYHIVLAGCDLMNGDVNGDGAVDFGDINPFVALLSHAP